MVTKEALEAAISSANTWSGRATLVLAIGIIGEYVVLPFLGQHQGWQKLAKILFACMVVLGIVGEYRYSSKIAQDSAALERLSGIEVAAINQRAGDARTSATTAHDEADKAATSAKSAAALAHSAVSDARNAQQETALLKSENTELANRIKEQNAQLNAVTPRIVVLRTVEEDLVQTVSRFQGQLIDVKICGMEAPTFRGLPTTDDGLEKVNVRNVLVDILILKAKWKWSPSGKGRPVYWTQCSMAWQQSRGIFVFVNASAPPDTMEAATVLSNELSSVLLSQKRQVLVPLENQEADDPESPIAVAKDPKVIAVLIGSMPLPDLTDTSSESATKKQ